jgi:hypothetical protein
MGPPAEHRRDGVTEQVEVLGGGQGGQGTEAGQRHRPILTGLYADGHPGFTSIPLRIHLGPVC